MKEALTIVVSLVTALGGWEAVKYLINRKTNNRFRGGKERTDRGL